MNVRSSALVTVIGAIFIGLPSGATAQGYQPPAGPTITPYLDYFNAPISPLLENYHTYVRPRADLRSRLRGLDTAMTTQQRRLDQLSGDFQQLNSSPAAPTGTGSTFMNYSHYFSGVQQQAYTPQRNAYRGGTAGVAVGGPGRGAGVARGLGTGAGGGFRGY